MEAMAPIRDRPCAFVPTKTHLPSNVARDACQVDPTNDASSSFPVPILLLQRNRANSIPFYWPHRRSPVTPTASVAASSSAPTQSSDASSPATAWSSASSSSVQAHPASTTSAAAYGVLVCPHAELRRALTCGCVEFILGLLRAGATCIDPSATGAHSSTAARTIAGAPLSARFLAPNYLLWGSEDAPNAGVAPRPWPQA